MDPPMSRPLEGRFSQIARRFVETPEPRGYSETGVSGGFPAITAITFSATSRAMPSLAVVVAEPRWGSRTTFSSASSSGSTAG
jgi:hypothetical protein